MFLQTLLSILFIIVIKFAYPGEGQGGVRELHNQLHLPLSRLRLSRRREQEHRTVKGQPLPGLRAEPGTGFVVEGPRRQLACRQQGSTALAEVPLLVLHHVFSSVSPLPLVLRVRSVRWQRRGAPQADLPVHSHHLPVQRAKGDARLS